MTTESGTHETRISRIEGILESVATKDFVRQVNAEMLKDINSKIDSKIDEQTSLFRSEMSEIHKEIKRFSEKQPPSHRRRRTHQVCPADHHKRYRAAGRPV